MIWENANGINNDEVFYEEETPKSIGNSHTLDHNTDDYQIIKENLKLIKSSIKQYSF